MKDRKIMELAFRNARYYVEIKYHKWLYMSHNIVKSLADIIDNQISQVEVMFKFMTLELKPESQELASS